MPTEDDSTNRLMDDARSVTYHNIEDAHWSRPELGLLAQNLKKGWNECGLID